MATFLALILSVMLVVKDYGTHGHTFPIEEEDLIEYLQNKIRSLDAKDMCSINQKLQKHYTSSIADPTSLDLPHATSHHIHYFDPTVVAQQDIKDQEGTIIVAKGASYNPLHHFSLLEPLLFFAGDDPSQIAWAKSFEDQTKWILVSGLPLELEKKENRPVYFDQNGLLVKKLKIGSVPAYITQEGNLLKIETIPIGKSCE